MYWMDAAGLYTAAPPPTRKLRKAPEINTLTFRPTFVISRSGVRIRPPAPTQVNMGEFQSGQMGQTVNLLAMPSVVRIHLPPPNKRDIRMDVSFIWRENRGGFEPRALRNVPGARFNPRWPARRQANPPYLLPAYTLTLCARKSPKIAVDPNRDPNADRSGKHRTVFARCFLRMAKNAEQRREIKP